MGKIMLIRPHISNYKKIHCLIVFSLLLFHPIKALGDSLQSEFEAKGGYMAYLAANVQLFSIHGINDEQKAFEHWKNHGRNEGRPFDRGRVRTDRADGSFDPNYAIDGGFCWQYFACERPYKTVVFITSDAPKPAGWDGRALLLQKGDLFNLGPDYTALAYRQLNPDVANAIDSRFFPSFASVTDHYVKYGFKEGRLTNGNWSQAQLEAWNDTAYLNQNPDVRGFFLGAQGEGWKLLGKIGFAHYMNFGETEGRGTGQTLTAAEQELSLRRSFDDAGYRARNPDVVSAIASGFFASAREHFDQGGKCEFAAGNINRRPNDYLDNAYYISTNQDVASAIASGIYATSWDHWRLVGAKEGRAGLPVQAAFDNIFYLQKYPELLGDIGAGKAYPTPLIHYLLKGQEEKRNPNPNFQESAYLARNPDVADAVAKGIFTSGFDHFQRYGKFAFAEGNTDLRADDLFDPAFYLSANPDVAAGIAAGTYATAWDHWRIVGFKENRAGLPVQLGFDESFYLSKYPELINLIGQGKDYPSAVVHYILQGQSENRNPNSSFDENYYINYYKLAESIQKGLVTSGYDHYQRYGKQANYRTRRAVNGVLTVGTGKNDYATIQDAINAANSGEEIRVPAGVYKDGAFGVFDKSLTIIGAGRDITFLEPGTKLDPAVKANTGGGIAAVIGSTITPPLVTIKGFTFRGGDNSLNSPSYKEGKSGALTVRGAKVLLSECDFRQNTALTGGAIIFENSPGSEVLNSRFFANSAQRDGGAIAALKNGLSKVANCIFEDNVVATLVKDSNGNLVETGYNYVHDGNSGIHKSSGYRGFGVSYPANSAARDGEFYDRYDTGPFRLSFEKVFGPAFFGYYGGPLGGAIALNNSSPVISGCEFRRNRANFAGGAIYMIEMAAPTIDGNYFEANQSSRGGAMYSESGNVTATIINNQIIANSSPADTNFPGSGKGGGLALYYFSKPLIQGNEFRDNWADYGGGAIGIYEDSDASIITNDFINNQVKAKVTSGSIPASDGNSTLLEFGFGAGGAIDVEVGNALIEENIFDGNQARLGGGIFVVGTASIKRNSIRNSGPIAGAVGTFAGDTTLIGSGVYLANPSGLLNGIKVRLSENTFGENNLPHDIVTSNGGNKTDLEQLYIILQPGARIQTFPF
jgi:hypothetical protein